MKWWFLCWLVSSWVALVITWHHRSYRAAGNCKRRKPGGDHGVPNTRACMQDINDILENGSDDETIDAMQTLESVLVETDVNETTSLSVKRLVAIVHKPVGKFMGLHISATETEATTCDTMSERIVSVHLPRELAPGRDDKIVFCMLTWPERKGVIWGTSDLYESRLVGLSVRGKNISGLQERVNISMRLTNGSFDSKIPSCVFFNYSSRVFDSTGCLTQWKPGQSYVTCSCDHLTYFGVLMVSASLSSTHQEILSCITLIGCSLSLFALVTTVVLFIAKRSARSDISMKVHVNLAVALILLNLHFLPSQKVAQLHSSGLCFYMALCLHYSLLATFSWMALEGFHLYLLLVRVFNIYIRRYLLKLSIVGWGVPAVIVMVVVAIDAGAYGRVHLDEFNTNSTEICYITNYTVKMVTTVGLFSLVFLFNLTMLGLTVRQVVGLRRYREGERRRAKRDACTLLGITFLLGITWGLVFFSFGYLTIPGLYLFCILNSLQGCFIFLWFCLSLRKTSTSVTTITNSETPHSKG